MENEYFSLSQVADQLQVKHHRIQYLLTTRAVAEPALRVAGKRLWSRPEIAALSEVLTMQADAKWERERTNND